MNSTEKENCLKYLDNLLSYSDIQNVKIKVEEIKDKVQKNELGEKLWKSPYGHWIFQTIVILVLIFSLYKLTIGDYNWFDSGKMSEKCINYDIMDISIYFFWLVMPPIFFLIEYIFLFGKDKSNRLNSSQIDDLKYCQELGTKIWAAVVICFSILLYVRYGFKF